MFHIKNFHRGPNYAVNLMIVKVDWNVIITCFIIRIDWKSHFRAKIAFWKTKFSLFKKTKTCKTSLMRTESVREESLPIETYAREESMECRIWISYAREESLPFGTYAREERRQSGIWTSTASEKISGNSDHWCTFTILQKRYFVLRSPMKNQNLRWKWRNRKASLRKSNKIWSQKKYDKFSFWESEKLKSASLPPPRKSFDVSKKN